MMKVKVYVVHYCFYSRVPKKVIGPPKKVIRPLTALSGPETGI